MVQTRPKTDGDRKIAIGLAKEIMVGRERIKEDPRAWFAAFPDVDDPLAVVRFVGAHPHPVASYSFQEVQKSLTIIQILRQEAEDSFKLAELAVIEVGHARKMEWDAIGKAMGYTRNRRQQAFTTYKRLVKWFREFELRQPRRRPRILAATADRMAPWRAAHADEMVAIAREILQHEDVLATDPDVADSLEMLAESLEDMETDGSVGTGLPGVLGVLSDECDKAKFGRLGGPVGAAVDALRAFTRAYRQADRHSTPEEA